MAWLQLPDAGASGSVQTDRLVALPPLAGLVGLAGMVLFFWLLTALSPSSRLCSARPRCSLPLWHDDPAGPGFVLGHR
jgi:hypothetical protein